MLVRRLRLFVGLLALAELVVFLLVAAWIGLGWTILATIATGALGWVLLARQGTRALAELRERARSRQAPGRELGDTGTAALGGLLLVLPGFLSDLLGLLFVLPPTRRPARGVLARLLVSRLPVELRGPVRVRSDREPHLGDATPMDAPMVIEGEVVRDAERGSPPS